MPRRNLLWIVCVVLVSFVCMQGAPGAGEDEANYDFYRMLVDALDHIEKSYVTEVDRKELLEGALEGMLNKLDPYSAYIAPQNFKHFERTTQGKFGGIGIQISMDRGRQLTVISPLVGTPAYRAGVLAGDRIVEIEGESTENVTLDDAVGKLTGVPGTQVTITIAREGRTEPLKLTLTREEIKIESVLGDTRKANDQWDWIIDKEAKVAYIRVNSFISSTAADLDRALREAQEDGMRGLVLDLRTNPGGLLQSAIEVSDMFLKTGKIVSTEGRNHKERPWKATGNGKFSDFPMTILVNHYSASASEIVSAALQDNNRAKIVGERTWGKGSVQNVIELDGGNSALKLTTAEYHRPNGHNIHRREKAKDTDEWGVTPDEKVEFTPKQMGEYMMWRRDRDILRNKTAEPKEPAQPKSDAPANFEDTQLKKALEIVGAQLKEKDKAVSSK